MFSLMNMVLFAMLPVSQGHWHLGITIQSRLRHHHFVWWIVSATPHSDFRHSSRSAPNLAIPSTALPKHDVVPVLARSSADPHWPPWSLLDFLTRTMNVCRNFAARLSDVFAVSTTAHILCSGSSELIPDLAPARSPKPDHARIFGVLAMGCAVPPTTGTGTFSYLRCRISEAAVLFRATVVADFAVSIVPDGIHHFPHISSRVFTRGFAMVLCLAFLSAPCTAWKFHHHAPLEKLARLCSRRIDCRLRLRIEPSWAGYTQQFDSFLLWNLCTDRSSGMRPDATTS